MPATKRPGDRLQDLLLLLAAALVPAALYVVFTMVPTEQTMGVVQRIFYFHVPSAFMTFLGVALCALLSALYLATGRHLYDVAAHASAEVAVLFCTIVLVTGPIWARPVWGVWWTGEVRLTSTLILWLIYIGYLLLRGSAENRDQAARWGAVVGIVGALDVPIIYKSVEWWRGLHPKVLRISGGGGLDPAMRGGFLLCIVTFLLLFALLVGQRLRLGLLQEEVEDLAQAARRGPAPGARPAGAAAVAPR